MKKLLAIVVLSLLLSSNANAKILNPYNLDMKDFWKKMNNTEFPKKIACKTQQVVNCGFKEKNCGKGVSEFKSEKDLSWGDIILDFEKGTFTKGKNKGTITYLGGLTYHIKTKKYYRQGGNIITIARDILTNQLTMIWETPFITGNEFQMHSGFCLIVE